MSAVEDSLPIANISCYRFAALDGLKDLRASLQEFCRERALKGTILLSTEGINLFVAGPRALVDELVVLLRGIEGLQALQPKYSYSESQPFRRMLVRIKREIIAFGVPGIDPARHTSPYLKPRELKQWLDEGRPVLLLDTRNDYEVKLGTFRGAQVLDISHFRDFPRAAQALPQDWRSLPVVSFCTGGIRCEKAAPYLESVGFEQVWQLEGGILKYFEEVGGEHYQGECFVFDQRVGLDPALRETDSGQCHACLTPLSADEMGDERHVPGVSCPHCYRSAEDLQQESLVRHQQALDAAACPLPGSRPQTQDRPLCIAARADGLPLGEALGLLFAHLPAQHWLDLVQRSSLIDAASGAAVRDLARPVRAGERFLCRSEAAIEPAVNARIELLHQDDALLVLNKPAPLPMHPCGRFERNTLQHLLHQAYAPQRPRAVHRLDANTSGLVLVARTRHWATLLHAQVAGGALGKLYQARVHGHPAWNQLDCDAPVSREPGAVGSREIDEDQGDESLTRLVVLERYADGTALLSAEPITGRTHQIRLHLWHLGHPIVGDPTYLPGGAMGTRQTLSPEDPPMALQACRLSFVHPISGARMEFHAPPLAALRP